MKGLMNSRVISPIGDNQTIIPTQLEVECIYAYVEEKTTFHIFDVNNLYNFHVLVKIKCFFYTNCKLNNASQETSRRTTVYDSGDQICYIWKEN